jgi:magnesium transporter
MTTATIFLADSSVETDDFVEITSALADPDSLVWIDICGPEEGQLEPLVDVLGLHELAVEDVNKHGQRAKLDRFPSHAFLVAYARTDDGDMAEVDFFVGTNWLLTVRELNDHGEAFPIDGPRARYERTRQVDRKVGYLLYTLMDSLVDGYFSAADQVEDRLELIEEDLFEHGPPVDGSLQQELLTLRRELIGFRRRVVPLRDVVLSLLRREIPWIEEEAILYFEDVLDHLLRVTDQIDTQRELMGNVVDASLALSSNRMNEVMKKMTSWGAILIVATLVAGIYGMNFQNMPELRWKYGYFMALGTMVATTGTLYLYFRRKKWL